MNVEELREQCLAIKGSTESLPFIHHNVLVFKVMGKIFCMVPLEPANGVFTADMKCNPERSLELREKYAGISHGHHPKSLQRNRIILESDVPVELILELIEHSVQEVLQTLSKTKRKFYEEI